MSNSQVMEERFSAWQSSYRDYQHRFALFLKRQAEMAQQQEQLQTLCQNLQDSIEQLQQLKRLRERKRFSAPPRWPRSSM